MLCPDCGKEKNTLPYCADEGGDNERTICAECTVMLFRTDYLHLIAKTETEIKDRQRRLDDFRASLCAILAGVAEKGEEKYIEDWQRSIES